MILVLMFYGAVDARPKDWFLVGMAPGLVVDGDGEAAWHAFVGYERMIWDRLGVGADAGYVAGWASPGYGYGVFSVGGFLYPLGHRENTFFVSSGYTLGWRSQKANFLHTGLGVQVRSRWRFEVRDYVNFDGADPNTHIWSFRLGVMF